MSMTKYTVRQIGQASCSDIWWEALETYWQDASTLSQKPCAAMSIFLRQVDRLEHLAKSWRNPGYLSTRKTTSCGGLLRNTWRPDAEAEGTLEEDRVANIAQWSPDGWER